MAEGSSRDKSLGKRPIVEVYDDEVDEEEEEEFKTKGIRVLLVDSDPESLRLVKDLLTQFEYEVTSYENGDQSLAFLMKNKHEIDLVIWDCNVIGLAALDFINKETHRRMPVVFMSQEHVKEMVLKSTKNGACDFILKPLTEKIVELLYRHVYRKKISQKDNQEEEEEEDDDDDYDDGLGKHNVSSKKPRIIWTDDLQQRFLKGVEENGGLYEATPKKILKSMEEDKKLKGFVTRAQVASHLQKQRGKVDEECGLPQPDLAPSPSNTSTNLQITSEANAALVPSNTSTNLRPYNTTDQVNYEHFTTYPHHVQQQYINPFPYMPDVDQYQQLLQYQLQQQRLQYQLQQQQLQYLNPLHHESSSVRSTNQETVQVTSAMQNLDLNIPYRQFPPE